MVKYNETGTNWNRCGTKYNPPENWTPPVKATPEPKPAKAHKVVFVSLLGALAALTDIYKGGDFTPRGFHLVPPTVQGVYFRRPKHVGYDIKRSKPWNWQSAPRHIASRQSLGDGLTNHQRVILNSKSK